MLLLGHTGVSQREGLKRKAHSKGGTTAARTCSEKPDAAPRSLLGAAARLNFPPKKNVTCCSTYSNLFMLHTVCY